MIFSGQKNKLELSHKRESHADKKNVKSKSKKKPFNQTGKSPSKSKSHFTLSGEHSSTPIKSVSIHKGQSNSLKDKNIKMVAHSQSCQLLKSKSRPKQFISKDQNTKNKKPAKYILNPLTNSKSHNSLSLNRSKQTSLSQSKTHSNQISTKYMSNQSYDMSLFSKSTDMTKMKKKSQNYIKNFNKTTLQAKECPIFENMHGGSMNQSRNFEKMRNSTENLENLRQIHVTDTQLDGVNLECCPKISQIRQNVNNLFKKLKEPSRNKLLLITNNYEKIVAELYEKINNKTNDLPVYDLSKIEHVHSVSQTDEESKVIKQNIVKIKDFSPSTSALNDDCSDSEHWDSYLEIDYKEKQNMVTSPGSSCSKQKLVKRLNLGDMKKMQIKQYQDEFMDNQQIFSESWKREINQQKRF